jgi:hypothetical protein
MVQPRSFAVVTRFAAKRQSTRLTKNEDGGGSLARFPVRNCVQPGALH